MKLGQRFRECCLPGAVANGWFRYSGIVKTAPAKRAWSVGMIIRLSHFTRSHTSVLTLSLPLIGLMIGGVLIMS